MKLHPTNSLIFFFLTISPQILSLNPTSYFKNPRPAEPLQVPGDRQPPLGIREMQRAAGDLSAAEDSGGGEKNGFGFLYFSFLFC